MENSVLVIDCRNRNLNAFVASATKAKEGSPLQLVLRHALGVGDIREVLNSAEEDGHRRFVADMPVLLMGGYAARGSAGHVAVHGHGGNPVTVVGGLGPLFGKGGLRPLGRPIAGVLVRGPVELEALPGASNSNQATAAAAWEGMQMLAQADRRSAFLVEGQSDYLFVVRLRPTGATGEGPVDFPLEHRAELFSDENIVRKMLAAQARRDVDEPAASAERIAEAVRYRLGRYAAAKGAATTDLWRPEFELGLAFKTFFPGDEVVARVAAEFSAAEGPAAGPVEEERPTPDAFVDPNEGEFEAG